MSLFGAATSGVDPQTGSYLNKEQRIAMFRASQGRGGSGGGSGSSKKQKPGVDPQSQIVVVRKNFSSAIRTVQEQAQETTTTVATQVAKNRKDIEALYNLISAEKAAELKSERQDTRNARIERESLLRRARERLIEGMSSALAGLANAGRNIAEKVLSPAKSLLQRLLDALKLLAAAWAIDNLPTILDNIRTFLDGLPKTKEAFVESLTNIRGTWSWLDNALGGVKKLLGKIAGTAWDVSKKIFRKAADIGKRVFRTVKNFVVELFSGIVNRLKPLIKGMWRRVTNALRPPKVQGPEVPKGMDPKTKDPAKPSPKADAPSNVKPGSATSQTTSTPDGKPRVETPGETPTGTATDVSGQPSSAPDKTPTPEVTNKPQKPWWKKLGDAWNNTKEKAFGKVSEQVVGGTDGKSVETVTEGVLEGVAPSKEQAKSTSEGLEALESSGKGKTVQNVTNMFEPIFKFMPDGGKGFKQGIKNVLGVIGRIPFIGWAIDTALNLADGQGIVESVIRGGGSNALGGLGWLGGAKLGGALGVVAGPPGVLLGAIAGGLLGSILAGAVGDQIGAAVYEGVTGETRSDTRPLGTEVVNNVSELITGSKIYGYVPPPAVEPPTPGVTPVTSLTTKKSSTTMEKTSGDTNVSTTEETTVEPAQVPEAMETPAPASPVQPTQPIVGKTNESKTEEEHSTHGENVVTKEYSDLTGKPLGNDPNTEIDPVTGKPTPVDANALTSTSTTTTVSETQGTPGTATPAVQPVKVDSDRTPSTTTPMSSTEFVAATNDVVDKFAGGIFQAISGKGPSTPSLLSRATAGESTPSGMTASQASRATTTVINMPPNFKTIPGTNNQNMQPPESQEGSPIPTYPTRDPESDKYRQMSARYYKLVF